MTAPKAKNLVSGTLAESITTSTTNILVHIGDNVGAQTITNFFPTAPFYITIMPKSPVANVANRLDSEIMLITAVSHDQVGNAALTATRAQRDTTAKAFGEGDIVTVGSYCDDAVFLDNAGTSETPTPWVNADDIVWSTMKCPFPSSTTIVNYGTITTETNITPTQNCFLIGKAVVLGSNSAAEVSTTLGGITYILGGIPYYDSSAANPNFQVGLCMLLKKGQTYTLRCGGYGRFEQIRTVGITWS